MSPEVLHRIVVLASECIDTPPHSGALITLMAVCGLSHKESYYDVFIFAEQATFAKKFANNIFVRRAEYSFRTDFLAPISDDHQRD